MEDRLREGLVAEYLCDGDARDSSGGGHHGVVHGATPAPDRFGRPGRAWRFDGVDDFIEVSPPPPLPGGALSLSVWFCCEPRPFAGWSNCVVCQDDGNDEGQERRIFQLSLDNGRLVWHRMIDARDPWDRRRIRPGVWIHAAAVADGTRHRLYVDGVLEDEVDHPLRIHAEQPLHIGRKGTPEPYFFFRGAIDDLRLWNRPLEEEEIALLAREGGWSPPETPGLPVSGDPLSGRWGQDGVVFLDLEHDGDHGVAGRIMAGRPDNMAVIERGSFDRATATLHLEGRARHHEDGRPIAWRIDGLLDGDEVAVIARFNGYSGNFVLTREGTRPRLTRRSLRSQLGALAWRLRRGRGRRRPAGA